MQNSFKPQRGKFTHSLTYATKAVKDRFKPQRGKFTLHQLQ